MDTFEKAYTPKEVSLTLDIGTSTLRKWCLSLEENGYIFTRTDNQRRLYVERDLVVLKYYKKLVQGENFSLDNAAKVIVTKYKENPSETIAPIVPPKADIQMRDFERSREIIEDLLERAEKQEQFNEELMRFNRELLDRLDNQQEYINRRLEERDKKLMESLRQSQETKKLMLELAAAKEESEKNKGLWKRLFGR